MKKTAINTYIVVDPDICHGKPTFAGTRIMVWQILDALAHGETIDTIIEDWPSLTPDHIKAAMEFAARRIAGERMTSLISA